VCDRDSQEYTEAVNLLRFCDRGRCMSYVVPVGNRVRMRYPHGNAPVR
jgi:hypothetical protein